MIRDGDGEFDISRFSGGEQDVFAVALRIALSRYLAELHGVPDNTLLIFDEILGSLDEERRGNMLQVLRADIPDHAGKNSKGRERDGMKPKVTKGVATCAEVQVAIGELMCSACNLSLKEKCLAQPQEKRNGSMICCIRQCLEVDYDLMFADEVPVLGDPRFAPEKGDDDE